MAAFPRIAAAPLAPVAADAAPVPDGTAASRLRRSRPTNSRSGDPKPQTVMVVGPWIHVPRHTPRRAAIPSGATAGARTHRLAAPNRPATWPAARPPTIFAPVPLSVRNAARLHSPRQPDSLEYEAIRLQARARTVRHTGRIMRGSRRLQIAG
jgi:hypothetical protein